MERRVNGPESEHQQTARASKSAPEPAQPGLLGLQRTAGNAAVAGALQRQREHGGGHGGPIPIRVTTRATAQLSSHLLREMADGTHGVSVADPGATADVDLDNAS